MVRQYNQNGIGLPPARYPQWGPPPSRMTSTNYETSRRMCRSSSGRLNEVVIRDSVDPNSPHEMGSAGLFSDVMYTNSGVINCEMSTTYAQQMDKLMWKLRLRPLPSEPMVPWLSEYIRSVVLTTPIASKM